MLINNSHNTVFPKNDKGQQAAYLVQLSNEKEVPLWNITQWGDLVEGETYLVIPEDTGEHTMQLYYTNQILSHYEMKEMLVIVVEKLEKRQVGLIKIIFNTGTEFKFSRVFGDQAEHLYRYTGIESDLIPTLQ